MYDGTLCGFKDIAAREPSSDWKRQAKTPDWKRQTGGVNLFVGIWLMNTD
jgi:hypothetical protein